MTISGTLGLAAVLCCTCTWPESILFSNHVRLAGDMTLEADLFFWRLDRITSGSVTKALAGDGSSAVHYTYSESRLLGLVKRQREWQVVHTASGPDFRSDEDGKVYRYRRQGGPPPLPAPADASDFQCERARDSFGAGLKSNPKFGTVAGYRVVIYESDDEDQSASFAFAPDLGCLVMRSSYRQRMRFGIPIEIGWWQVTAVRRGTPDPRLFAFPQGRVIVDE